MATVQDLLTQALTEGGLDATNTQALAWFNERHKELVGIARTAEGGTAAATFAAALPADKAVGDNVTTLVVDPDIYPALVSGVIATGLRRGDQSSALADVHEALFREGAEKMRVRVNQRYVTQTAESVQELLNEAVAADGFDATQAQLLIWLNRRHREMVAHARAAEAGQAPATFLAALPADVAAAAAVSSLVVDADCYNGLISGVIADGLLRHGKDPDLADRYEAKFREAAERMRVRVQQRYLTQTTDSVQALLNEAAGAEGFDATQAQLLLWLNRRHRDMVALSRSYRDRVDVGPTVADQEFYAVAGVVETYNVEVNGVPFSKARRPDVYADSQGGLVWCGPSGSGFVVEDVNATNVQGFTLIPSPETAGLSINVWAAVMPPDLVAGDAVSALKVDSDCYDALVSGVIASGLMRAQQASLAAPHERVYEAAVEKLRRRVKRRYNTMGPAQIRVQGITA